MRRPDSPEDRLAKRERLRALLLPIAEELWRTTEGGPTREEVAARTLYSNGGLKKALDRAGLTWGEVKHDAGVRISGAKGGHLGLEAA